MKRAVRWCVVGTLTIALLAATSGRVDARIIKTRRASQARPGVGFTIGSGFEYQPDGEQTEYGFPFLLDWALTPKLDLVVEPVLIAIEKRSGASVRGWDDLESTLDFEIVSERRHRPAIALEAGIKWPTASDPEIGTGLTDYSFGVLASKDVVRGEFNLNLLGAHVGLPPVGRVQDTIQLSAATDWHLTPDIDLTIELLTTQGLGGLRGRSGLAAPGGGGLNVPGAGGGSFEATFGLAHYFGKRLKLEEGLVVQSDGAWQVVAAWEWDFGDGR